MSRVFDVLFNDGQDESADKIALPDGKFRLLQNARLERDGRVAPRQNYASLTNVVAPGAASRFRAFDLVAYQDRLMSIGTQDGVTYTPVYGKQLFTYVNNAQNVWLPHLGPNLGPITQVTKLWASNTGLTANSADVAYTNGQLCVVQTDVSKTQVTVNRLTTSGAVLSIESFSAAFATCIVSARVCACGNVFVLVIRQTNGDLVARRFDTAATATNFSGSTVLEAATTAVLSPPAWDLVSLGGTTDFLITYPRTTAGNTRVRRHVSAAGFAVVNTLDIAGGAFACAVIGDTTHTVVHALNSGTSIDVRTLSTALAVTAGPSTLLGTSSGLTAATGQPGLAFADSLNFVVMCSAAGTLGDLNSQSAELQIAGHGVSRAPRENKNVRNVSKPFSTDTASNTFTTGGETWALGSLPAGGNENSTLRFFSTCVHGVDFSVFCAGIWNYGIAGTWDTGGTNNTMGRSSVVSDGTTYYALCTTLSGLDVGAQVEGTLQLVKIRAGQPDRRQATEMQGALYISGGFVYAFDGGLNSAELGFLDTPVFDTTITASATGALTLLATYTYIAMYEYVDANGFTHRSTPSDPVTTTLTGANNALAFTVSAPHSIRRLDFGQNSGVRVVLYRTTPNDSVFYRVAETTVLNTATFAGVVSITDTRSDTDAQTREVLYIYSQKPTANVAAITCRFLAAGRDRLIYGGLPDPYIVALSQLVFPGEPVENASPNAFAFLARLPGPCTGVAVTGDTYIAFTDDAVYAIPGAGPQRNGTGEFFSPQTLDSDVGCIDWRSILTCGDGIFFQAASDKLFIIGSQGAPTWIGQPVRDTLAAYPTISGAVLCSATQRVIFACSNLADNDGVLLVYDLRRKIWSVDTIGQPVRSVVEYQGRLAYVAKDGLVYLENTEGTFSGALPSVSLRTGSFKLFPANGNGELLNVVLSGTYTGDCTVEGFISYDDGKNWISMGQQACTTANLFNHSPNSGAAVVSGDAVTVRFEPNIREITNRFALRFDITNGTDNGGLWAHMISLEVDAQEFATRQPARNQR
jgi:hypothetical protein